MENSSSDSEIECKFKIDIKQPYKTCLICDKPGLLVCGYKKSFSTFVQSIKLREDISKESNFALCARVSLIKEENNYAFINWHKSCYSSFTSKKYIKTLKKQFALKEQVKAGDDGLKQFGIYNNFPKKRYLFLDKCIFCPKRSNKKILCQVLTTNIENKIKLIAQKRKSIHERIGSNDLIAIEVKYHASCFNTEWKKCKKVTEKQPKTKSDQALIKLYKILTKGFLQQKGFGITSVYNKYLELGGYKSKRHLVRLIQLKFGDNNIESVKSKSANRTDIIMTKTTKDETVNALIEEPFTSYAHIPILNTPSELSHIHKIVADIRTEMVNIPEYIT